MSSVVENTLPIRWEEKKFQDLIESNVLGLVRSVKQQSLDFSYDYVKMNNVTNDNRFTFQNITRVNADEKEVQKFMLKKGDFLFNTRNSFELVGKSCVYNEEKKNVLFNNNLMRVRFNNDVHSQFILYQFSSPYVKHQLEKVKSGTTNVSAIYYKSLKEILIHLPPLSEQKRIVAKIDSLFAKIDKAIALTEESLKQAENLFTSSLSSIFIDFEKSYPTTPLMQHINFIGGSQPPKSSFSYEEKDGFVRLIQIRDYKSDNNIVYINKELTKKFCNEDDIMIGRYGPPVFQILRGLSGAYNVALMKAIPDENIIIKDFLFYFLQNSKIQNYIISISQRSAGQSGVNKKALEAYRISIPPLDVQKKYVEIFSKISTQSKRKIICLKGQIKNLKNLKSSILAKAFSGEL